MKYNIMVHFVGGLIGLIVSYFSSTFAFMEWAILVGSIYFVLTGIINIYFYIYKAPESLKFIALLIELYMPFGRKYIISFRDIHKIKVNKQAKFWSIYPVEIMCPVNRMSFFVNPKYVDNFQLLIETVKKENPNCEIDKALLSG